MTISLNQLKSVILRWRFLAGNSMEKALENLECIKVSLPCVYNCSVVLKTENRSLSKAIIVSNLLTPPLKLTLGMAQWVWMALLALSEITSSQNFGTIGCQKPPKRGHISSILHRNWKDLEIYNLTTINATLMIHQNYVLPTP